jgi:hypothetical protein
MAKRNTQDRRDAEERARNIQAAEERAERAHAKALARVEAEGLWASVEKADAARIPEALALARLQEDLAGAYRAGRALEWPHFEALRAAESRSRTFEAVFEAIFEKYIRVMNADEYTFRRPLILKAAAQDVARAARVGGGKTSGGKRKQEADEEDARIRAKDADVQAQAPSRLRLTEQKRADAQGIDRKRLRKAYGKTR